MNGWLLDTDIVSELRKRRPDRRVKAWADAQPAHLLFLSSVTLAEIRYGIALQTDLSFRSELEHWLENHLRPWFADRILPIDEDVILEWRNMVARGKAKGMTFSQPDLFIAATARLHSLTVCTRNSGAFVETGAPVFNPWSGRTAGAAPSARPGSDPACAPASGPLGCAPSPGVRSSVG